MTQPLDTPSSLAGGILVFIPAYNCAPQIPRVLAQFKAVPPGIFREILVVDNHSKDATVESAIAAAQDLDRVRVQVVRNSANYGLGGSHKSAFAYALANGFDYVAVLHGDDQGRIADLLPILSAGLHRHYDCCLGSRFMSGARLEGYPITRVLGNHIFNALFTLVSMRRITDLGSGLNIFSRKAIKDSAIQKYSDDLRFNCYLLLGLCASGINFKFFPISWREEDQVSNVKMVSQSLKTLGILWEYLSARRRFRETDHRDVPREAYTFEVLGGNLLFNDTASHVEHGGLV